MGARILMCPPLFYGIEYEINPWMSTERQADHTLAGEQWDALRAALELAGASIEVMTPVKGLPDLVFTANAAMVYRRQAIVARFKHPQRQGETPLDRAWLEGDGFEVFDPPAELSFEGAGDALFCGDTLYAGYRMRSDAGGHQKIGEVLGVRVLPLELADPYYYHLDTCFCPLAEDQAIYFPGAFDEYGQKVLEANIGTLIPVAEDEARSFACNAVVVGKTVVTNAGCPKLHENLRAHGYTAIATPLGEFVKAGGSAKCLTLRLDGEEAAGWKHTE
ncbi:N(G),N(G)-dimethylarginine dimethylaminohydrolase [Posidoniimonas polymericola]|uniref:N(G),N(G)-dimethylarginine dimethylaminohydrolase n=1 Tax=Posidoniimonas polymericola TaxID=2528002 RepID=A0A5C5YKV8_9BACT|nr:arginine deiminase-related protein [Posidoniimonas polymericola]TWT75555.1 N(G),N(G)-dimethylarginine dimethylaminohydrolase [Posidoniimonas polymericola]